MPRSSPGAAFTVLRSALGAPPVAVAVKVTGLPATPAALTVAVSVFGPALPPSVQRPTVAMPSAPVVAFAPVRLPLPDATAKVTGTPGTGVPPPSRTTTAGSTGTGSPAVADCPSPAAGATAAGAPRPSAMGVLTAGA